MTPKVSILMPCYNAEKYVGAALESALAQTWPDVEIIAVNDGSTDATRNVLRAYEARGVMVIDQTNRGQSTAANVAFRHSSGDLIKFLDADDLLSPDHVQLQAARISKLPDHVAMGEWARFYNDEPEKADFRPLPMYRDAEPAEWLATEWLEAKQMTQCGCFLIPRVVLDRSGLWDERLSLINDLEFFTRVLLSARRIAYTPGARLYYRSGLPGSLSARTSRRAVESAFLSSTLAVERLLAAENSALTRLACANVMKYFDYRYYPDHGDLRAQARRRALEFGGASIEPDGPPAFHVLRKIVGWRLARRIQLGFRRDVRGRMGL
jgi:glycosyltransferase involved in cell wall biosynthesis